MLKSFVKVPNFTLRSVGPSNCLSDLKKENFLKTIEVSTGDKGPWSYLPGKEVSFLEEFFFT